MADTYEKDLGQKSSLTTSDYIRVVGSDNVSYKQDMTSVLALNGTFYDITWHGGVDLNTMTQTGIYWLSNNLTNCYIASVWAPMVVISKGDTVRQIIFPQNGDIYTREYRSSQWSAWVKQPTRAEVDALSTINEVVPTKTSDVNTFEYNMRRVGKLVTGSIIFSISSALASNGYIVQGGIPTAAHAPQLPLICVNGTQAGQTGRVRVNGAGIQVWYSNVTPTVGNTYLIPVNYICQ